MSNERKYLAKALSIVESAKYKMGGMEFIKLFIHTWAYQQSAMYPPQENFPYDLEQAAIELSEVIADAIKENPAKDVLGELMAMCDFEKRGTGYYPTPSGLSRLLSALIVDKGYDGNTFYEACCGSGSITLNWLEQIIEERGVDAIKNLELHLEDIDPIMIKSSFIQLMFYFQTIGVAPAVLSLDTVDVISRKSVGISYYATTQAPSAHLQAAVA